MTRYIPRNFFVLGMTGKIFHKISLYLELKLNSEWTYFIDSLCMCVYIINIYIYIYIYIYTPTPLYKLDMTQGQFFKQFNRFRFSFLSSRLVAIPRLKISICPTIYSWLKGNTNSLIQDLNLGCFHFPRW